MIFLHLIFGVILGLMVPKYFWFIFLGVTIADLDHLYVILRYRLFTYSKIIDSLKFEEKYKIQYKTPIVHSIFGAILFSSLIGLFNVNGGIFYFIGHLVHLLLDLPDIDKKLYLYPFKRKISGFLPIWSLEEQAITIVYTLLIIFLIPFGEDMTLAVKLILALMPLIVMAIYLILRERNKEPVLSVSKIRKHKKKIKSN